MKRQRILRRLTIAVGAVAVLYFAIGGIYVYKESHREESWHEKAVANAGDQSSLEWRAAMGSKPVAEWFFVNEKRHTYVVRLFDNRKYVSAIFDQVVYGVGDPINSPSPKRFSSGKLSRAEWRKVDDLLGSMYANREQFFANSNRREGNVTLAYSHNNAVPIRYRLFSDEYPQWPAVFREFDDLLFAAMTSWGVKPHHGYARDPHNVSYGPAEIPNLLRVLRSDRESAFPGIVSRLVALGEPSRAPLTEILRTGEDLRYLPISRYVAVMDGLAELGGSTEDAGFTLIKRISEAPASLPGKKALKAHAATIAGAREIERHIEQAWTLPQEVESRFRTSTLSPEEQKALALALKDIDTRLDAKKAAAKATLIEIGTPVLPAVLERLKSDHARSRFPRELLDVLAEVGGADAFVFAIRENGMRPSLATRPLARIGNRGAAGLLLLLESSEKLARMESFYALEKDADIASTAQYVASLNRNLELYEASSSVAVRAVHSDATLKLIKLLQKHSRADKTSIAALLRAALDTNQRDQTRILALNTLAEMVPLPDSAERQLRELSGYESGKVYDALSAVIAQ